MGDEVDKTGQFGYIVEKRKIEDSVGAKEKIFSSLPGKGKQNFLKTFRSNI